MYTPDLGQKQQMLTLLCEAELSIIINVAAKIQ